MDIEYNKYAQKQILGLLCNSSTRTGLLIDPRTNGPSEYIGKLRAFVPALQTLSLWHHKTINKLDTFMFNENESNITSINLISRSITTSKDSLKIAVGYQNGQTVIVNHNSPENGNEIETKENLYLDKDKRYNIEHILNGHKKAVTAFCTDNGKEILASGSKDTDIFIWNLFEGTGLARLKAHTNEITGLQIVKMRETNEGNFKGKEFLVSCSKDGLVKIWDLMTFECVESITGHSGEVWSLESDLENQFLFTGSIDAKIRVWKWNYKEKQKEEKEAASKMVSYFGGLETSSKGKVSQLVYCGNFLFASDGNKKIDVFVKMDEKYALKKAKKRRRKQEKKGKTEPNFKKEDIKTMTKTKTKEKEKMVDENTPRNGNIKAPKKAYFTMAKDYFKKKETLVLKTKVVSMAAAVAGENQINGAVVVVCASLRDNSVVWFRFDNERRAELISKANKIGHRRAPRSVDFYKSHENSNKSSNKSLFLTASSQRVKIWSLGPDSSKILRTFKHNSIVYENFQSFQSLKDKSSVKKSKKVSEPIFKALFVNKQFSAPKVAVATTKGTLAVFDVESGTVNSRTKEGVPAEITALECDAEEGAIVTGGSDGVVAFFRFDSEGKEELKLEKKLSMEESVTSLKLGPKNKFICVGLINATIKIHFVDSLKFFLSLYGHKLPVASIDMSHDGKLVVSGAADKNVKIWGADFGDCHKSIFAHNQTVTEVRFAGTSHIFFSSSRDKLIKMWDADKFVQLMVLRGHSAEVWSLSIAPDGNTIASVSADFSVRVWRKTNSLLFPDEEEQNELEREFEKYEKIELENEARPGTVKGSGLEDPLLLLPPTKRTKYTSQVLEMLTKALDKTESFFVEDKEGGFEEPFKRVESKFTKCAMEEFCPIITRISSNELYSALPLLRYHYVKAIIKCLAAVLVNKKSELDYDRYFKIIVLITKINESQLVSDEKMAEILSFLSDALLPLAKKWRDRSARNCIKLSELAKLKEKDSNEDSFNVDGTRFESSVFIDRLEALEKK